MREVSPARVNHEGESVFQVDVQVVGLALVHRWTGFAADSQQASERGFSNARTFYRGHALVVRAVVCRFAQPHRRAA